MRIAGSRWASAYSWGSRTSIRIAPWATAWAVSGLGSSELSTTEALLWAERSSFPWAFSASQPDSSVRAIADIDINSAVSFFMLVVDYPNCVCEISGEANPYCVWEKKHSC